MTTARGEKAAEHDPADHCSKNEPKLRIYRQYQQPCHSPWPPLVVKFSAARKAPGNPLDAMSQGRTPNWRQAKLCQMEDLAAPGSSRNTGRTALSVNPGK